MNAEIENATMEQGEFRLKGRSFVVPLRNVMGHEVIAVGRWPRIASLRDEEWMGGYPVLQDPEKFIQALKSSGLPADILTFSGPIGADRSDWAFSYAEDNVAAIRTDDFATWWEGLPQEARKNTRRSAKRGVEVRLAVYDSDFVSGIKSIYDEAPIRQGRKFWHYGKDIETVRRENATYLDRSEFLGAYFNNELIGFVKYVFVDDTARIMQILCLNSHQDKRPIIALIVKAAERCHERGVRYLIYGKYTYGQKTGSSITEFKKRLGFEQIGLRRYYVPLSLSGRIAMFIGAHKSLHELLPSRIYNLLLDIRTWWLTRTLSLD
jgi:hypothetical protein